MSVVARVIPLRRYRKERPAPIVLPGIPEPVELYCLMWLTFVLHIPYKAANICIQCHTQWPCEEVRLAFRLREGF